MSANDLEQANTELRARLREAEDAMIDGQLGVYLSKWGIDARPKLLPAAEAMLAAYTNNRVCVGHVYDLEDAIKAAQAGLTATCPTCEGSAEVFKDPGDRGLGLKPCPDCQTRPNPPCSSSWRGETLIWTINGEDISDVDLRRWCHANLSPPWDAHSYIMQRHVDEWAARDKSKDPQHEEESPPKY